MDIKTIAIIGFLIYLATRNKRNSSIEVGDPQGEFLDSSSGLKENADFFLPGQGNNVQHAVDPVRPTEIDLQPTGTRIKNIGCTKGNLGRIRTW